MHGVFHDGDCCEKVLVVGRYQHPVYIDIILAGNITTTKCAEKVKIALFVV
jgi:hypothetical protein